MPQHTKPRSASALMQSGKSEGRPHGREWDHWAQASQEILSHASVTPEPAPTTKPRKTTKGRIRAALKSAISA